MQIDHIGTITNMLWIRIFFHGPEKPGKFKTIGVLLNAIFFKKKSFLFKLVAHKKFYLTNCCLLFEEICISILLIHISSNNKQQFQK